MNGCRRTTLVILLGPVLGSGACTQLDQQGEVPAIRSLDPARGAIAADTCALTFHEVDNLPFSDDAVLNYVVDFLQRAHLAGERYTVRDGINVARYALKLIRGNGEHPLRAYKMALEMTLGEDAVGYVEEPA